MTPTIKAKETFEHIKSLFSFITDLIPPSNSLVTPHSFFSNKSVSHQIANILDDTLNLQI